MDNIFKQRIITIRNISPYLTMQEIQKENLKDFAIHKLIKDGSTFHIYMSHADGDSAIKKLEKDLKALPMRSNSVGMKLHSNILCITGITSSLNEDILRQVLQGFGEVLLPFKLIKSKKTNESKGYGWLVFKDIKSAEKCMWMIAKIELQSRPLHAGWAGNNVTCEDDLSTVSTLYVQGLPSSIATVKDLRQFLSKNDEISFCQFLMNEDPSSQSNVAVVEFKNSEAAEQCVIKNNGTKVIDGILQLTYAIPGYAGVDFVWNKPANIQFKRSQPNNRSLQHSNQCSGPIRLPKCCPSGYVRPMMNMQVTPGYQNTMGQIPSHYVPMSDMIRPQLVGVRPFVYTPTGLHSMQHSHVHQHFNYPQQYPVRNQQPHQQIMQYQQQQTTNEYQPQTPLPPNQLLPQQLPNQSQPPVAEMQQQILVEEHHQHPNLTSSIHSVVQHHQPVKIPPQPPTYQISFQQSQENDNLLQQPHEIAVSNQQQQEQSKQHSMALHHVEPKEKELSQKLLEGLTIAYQEEQQQKQKQQQHPQEKLQLGQKQKHSEKQQQQKQAEQPQQQQQQPQAQHQQQPQLQQHQRQPQLQQHQRQPQQQQQQQQQEQRQKQQPKQAQQQQPQHQQKQQPQQHEQQQQETERNQKVKAAELSSEKEQRKAEQQQKQETEIKNKQQNDKKAKQYNTETCSRTTAKSSHELNSNCSENYKKISKQSSCLTSSSEQAVVAGAHTESHSVSNSISIDERQSIDGGKRHVNNGDNIEVKGCKPPKIQHVVIADQDQSTGKIKEGIKEHKQSKQDITAIRILQNTKMPEDSKRGISLKPNGMSSPAVLKKPTDTKRTKKNDQLQQETLQPKLSLQIEKERQKDLPIKTSEKKLLLPPKEKLLLLQQQIKRQAEALERLTRTKTKAELRQERNKTQKKSPCVPVKSALQDSMITEKLSSEAKTHSEASSEVQLPKKCEGTKVSIPGKKSQDSLKLTEKEEDIAPRRSPSKVKLAERMNVHDDSETKEKRPRLDTDASSIRSSTENNASTKVPIKCSSDMTDINSTKSVGIYEKNNEKNSNPGHPVDVFSMTPVIKSKPKKDQSLKPPKKTNELFSTSDEASSKLCSLMNQMSLKDEITGTTASMDELKQVNVTTMATTTTPKVTAKEASVNLNKRCMESEGDDTKKVLGQITAQSNETDKLKTPGQQHCKYQDVNYQLSDKENMNVYLQEKPNERLCHKSDVATVQEKQKLPKPLGQEKQKSSPVVVVDSKAVNVLSNVKMSERNIKIELGPTINQPGIIRPIPKIPLQSISSHGVVPEFSAIPMPSPFPHPHPQINNMQQFQTFTNNQFQPIMRAEAGMGRKVNFVFNHPVLPPMPSAHLLTQNDTFTTNTHYEPVMVPNPLFVGVPGMTGHTPHHIARPIPHIPPQPWQAMALPPMMHPRMTHFPPAYPPVLPNIGVNRNAPEFYSKMPERLPKIQPDAAFHLQYNNLANMQMRFAGRNLNEEASFHMPPFKLDAQNPTAQFKNDFSTDRPAINLNNRDVFGYTAAGATNICKNDGIPTIHDSTPVQASDIKSAGISSKVLTDLTYEQLAREQGNSSKDEGKINIAKQQPIKMETKCFSAKQPMLKPIGNFKQSGRVPTFNRTVRELISVPFTSDESRLLYLLKKKHQGHPIAQEWLFFCNGLLTSHFRKLWDPPCKENDLHSNSEEVKTDCVCKREPDTLKCYSCSKQFFGRVRYHCELHPYREYLTDLMYCPYCGIDLVWTEEPW